MTSSPIIFILLSTPDFDNSGDVNLEDLYLTLDAWLGSEIHDDPDHLNWQTYDCSEQCVPNDPPVLEFIGDQEFLEDETLDIELIATDPEGATLTYSVQHSYSLVLQIGLVKNI